MSLVRLGAELIRRAAADENYALDLDLIGSTDPEVFRALVSGPVEDHDRGILRPSEWLWFAKWRQGLDGAAPSEAGDDVLRAPLDLKMLSFIANSTPSRYLRFELRGLVMRDRVATEHLTAAFRADRGLTDVDGSGGWAEIPALHWTVDHAREAGGADESALELTRDALQHATEPAWFTLRHLTRGESAGVVGPWLTRFADEREVPAPLRRRWGLGDR